MTTTEKTCFKCGVTKPLTEFYAHKHMADGHLNKCKCCAKQDVHQHRHGAGRDRVLAYDRERAKTPKRVKNRADVVKKWEEAHPERRPLPPRPERRGFSGISRGFLGDFSGIQVI